MGKYDTDKRATLEKRFDKVDNKVSSDCFSWISLPSHVALSRHYTTCFIVTVRSFCNIIYHQADRQNEADRENGTLYESHAAHQYLVQRHAHSK